MKLPEWHGVRMVEELNGGVFDPVGLGIFWIDEQERPRRSKRARPAARSADRHRRHDVACRLDDQ